MDDILPTYGFSGLVSHLVENSLWVSKGIFRTPLPSINPTALLKLTIIACRGFSGSKLANGVGPSSIPGPLSVLFFHKRTTDFLRNIMTTSPDNIATMGISTSPFGPPIPERCLAGLLKHEEQHRMHLQCQRQEGEGQYLVQLLAEVVGFPGADQCSRMMRNSEIGGSG